ncbi:FKBP-type peptidyl-prolyl cis-trans isomerase [Pontiella sulfatireligans]|uniref:Peptidyl-prolyl cis-trans isomerase n=1 Tax=Pontiella sulfatireligans TaxID=2750658 RepID=A0A6C2UIQ4_9BACT|nr:peptidylprolyl isomerase [Pontiella sulfatireligans]VGO19839.1 FKBP-type peptidyl-prolyl cis-trans isomerase SlyD [Pontiella sulfatireligans]
MIENGQKVKIHYTGTLDDGNQFDSSAGRDPLEFEMGAGMVIPGFETGVKDMAVGEKKSIHIPATEAYGEKRDEMVMEFEKSQLPEGLEPKAGMGLQMQGPQGQPVPVQITAVAEETITIDANHPLAGQNLNFELELVEVN